MRSHGVVRGGIIRLLVIIPPVIRRVAIEAVWTRAVDARIDPKCERRDYLKCMEGRWRRDGAITVLLAHSGIGPCELADKLRDAPAPYTVVYAGENWGAFSSQVVNRTAKWGYWTTRRGCGY